MIVLPACPFAALGHIQIIRTLLLADEALVPS
jgi:hypothetical protein